MNHTEKQSVSILEMLTIPANLLVVI